MTIKEVGISFDINDNVISNIKFMGGCPGNLSALSKLLEEDKTLRFEFNPETKQQLLSGIGDQHLDITLAKLKSKFKIRLYLCYRCSRKYFFHS